MPKNQNSSTEKWNNHLNVASHATEQFMASSSIFLKGKKPKKLNICLKKHESKECQEK